jgi:hypothetical protein
MSRTDDTTEDSRRGTGTPARELYGMLRRMVVTLTSKPFWQVVGVLLLDGVTKETVQAEAWPGVGYYSRPPTDGNPEAIVGHTGGAENPAIMATRDEKTRKRMAAIQANETAIFNGTVRLLIDKDGHILAQIPGGATKRLAFVDELNALRAFVASQFATGAGHIHATPSGPTTTITIAAGSTLPSTAYTGSDVLRSQ